MIPASSLGCTLQTFALEGRTAIVTGGLGLVGRGIVAGLAGCGAAVIIADVDPTGWSKARADFEKAGLMVEFSEMDVANTAALPGVVRNFDQKHEPDIWVNAAYPRTSDWGDGVETVTAENWSRNVDMQMNSACILASEAAKLLAGRGRGGSIINIASIYGVVSPDFAVYDGLEMTTPPAYAAIKGGIIAYTRYLAGYWGGRNIRVNAVCPGGVFDNQPESFVAAYEARTPLGRMADPDDIAAPVAFLASDAARYITGATLMVDGGWTAQ
jgi:NAD(P)-dependent dehydrogenase (short-subunit alcohol dehydrogenase family)